MKPAPQTSGPGLRQQPQARLQHSPQSTEGNACRANDSTPESFVTWLAALLPAGRPRRISRMTGQATPKYQDIKGTLAADWLSAHATGLATYAATIDRDGLSRLGAIDIDAGGIAALAECLARCAAAGLTAWAIAVDTPGKHSGGHIWVVYRDWCAVADIRAQLQALAPADAELWPSGNVIRLPFGVHRLAQTRGQLLTQAGQLLDLDNTSELASAIDLVQHLPMNAAPAPAPARPAAAITPTEVQPLARPANGRRMSADETRQAFNAAHPIASLMEQYGAKETPDGWACNCGYPHTHETQLTITDEGKIVAYSHNCRWAPLYDSGQARDSFSLYCLVEHHDNFVAALKSVSAPAQRQQQQPAATEADRRAEAARKRAERARRAETTRSAIEARAAHDEQLSGRAQLVLQMLLATAKDRDWCRPSIAALCLFSAGLRTNGKPYSERTIQLAIAELETSGYITSEGHGGRTLDTAYRHFLASPPDVSTGAKIEGATTENFTHVHVEHVLDTDSLEHVSRAQSPAPVPLPDRRTLLSEIRRLARQANEAGWWNCNYDALTLQELTTERDRLCGVLLASSAAEATATVAAVASAAAPDAEALHGPDGAIAYPDGAAWLPSEAAQAWWEALPYAQRVPVAEPGGYIELDPPAAAPPSAGPILPPAQPKRRATREPVFKTPRQLAAQIAALENKAKNLARANRREDQKQLYRIHQSLLPQLKRELAALTAEAHQVESVTRGNTQIEQTPAAAQLGLDLQIEQASATSAHRQARGRNARRSHAPVQSGFSGLSLSAGAAGVAR